MTKLKINNIIAKCLFCGLVAIGFNTYSQTLNPQPPAAQPNQKINIENLINSRIEIKNMSTIVDASQGNIKGAVPKNISSFSWTPDGKGILVDMQGTNQYYAIAYSEIDGNQTNFKVLTNTRVQMNTRLNNSNPTFYVDGKHFIFVGQDIKSTEYKKSLPGYGLFCNLLFSDIKGIAFTPLTDYVSTFNYPKGAVMPSFSKDGKRLVWTHTSSSKKSKGIWGDRQIIVANFSLNNDIPSLTNLKTFAPGEGNYKFYETYGFTPDGKRIVFASNLDDGQEWVGMDICTMSFNTGEIKKLTDTPTVWDRYAAYSPNGKKIVWSSSEGYSVAYMGTNGVQWQNEIMSDLWIMNANGSEKRRISSFNDRTTPMFAKTRCYIGQIAWHPTDPNKLAFILNKHFGNYNISSSIIVAELGNILDKSIK